MTLSAQMSGYHCRRPSWGEHRCLASHREGTNLAARPFESSPPAGATLPADNPSALADLVPVLQLRNHMARCLADVATCRLHRGWGRAKSAGLTPLPFRRRSCYDPLAQPISFRGLAVFLSITSPGQNSGRGSFI